MKPLSLIIASGFDDAITSDAQSLLQSASCYQCNAANTNELLLMQLELLKQIAGP